MKGEESWFEMFSNGQSWIHGETRIEIDEQGRVLIDGIAIVVGLTTDHPSPYYSGLSILERRRPK